LMFFSLFDDDISLRRLRRCRFTTLMPPPCYAAITPLIDAYYMLSSAGRYDTPYATMPFFAYDDAFARFFLLIAASRLCCHTLTFADYAAAAFMASRRCCYLLFFDASYATDALFFRCLILR